MKNLKKAALIALSALMILALAACGKSGNKVVYRTLDEIRDSGTVNIGVFSDKNPFGYVDENGEYQGYDVYFANRLVKDLGVDVEFVSTEAASRLRSHSQGPRAVSSKSLRSNAR